jgi:diphthamide synthase (EF-2-diphthine--ammonia ligase)
MERIKEIERSIIKTYRKELWAKFVRALDDYELLSPNDKVCVCISGGKDSMILAKLFQELHRHSKFEFELKFLMMNPGYNKENLDLIMHNLEVLNIPAHIVESNIFEVANSQEKNPCYLCARMRRGVLYKAAKELGCNKIALGHHYDDVIETTLMNMLNSGSFQTMVPKLHSLNFEGMEQTVVAIDFKERILKMRGEYVIMDKDIAQLYGVTTSALNQAVKRNINRFPSDFMFQLTVAEFDALKSQIVIAKAGRGGSRNLPYAFTEHGGA